MLQDPENFEEWSQEIWAQDQAMAERYCQTIANNAQLTEVLNVTQKSKRPGKRGMCKFICWFRSETHDSSDNSGN